MRPLRPVVVPPPVLLVPPVDGAGVAAAELFAANESAELNMISTARRPLLAAVPSKVSPKTFPDESSSPEPNRISAVDEPAEV